MEVDGTDGHVATELIAVEPVSHTTRWIWWLLETLALVAIEILLRRAFGPCYPRRHC